jgi:hypothetical protein
LPTQKLVTIESWSYSRNQTYQACPLRARFLYVDKLKEPEGKSPALQHGTRVHALAAAWVTKRLPDFAAWDGKELLQYRPELERVVKQKKIPAELARFEREFGRLIKSKARCEEMWCLDRQWEIIPGSGWSPHVWLRVKVDSHFLEDKTAYIIDYKTGKFNPEHADQRSLYALAAFAFYPDAVAAHVYHWYTELGVEKGDSWEVSEVDALKKEWALKTTAMLQDNSFLPTPSPSACRWCSFKRSLGGPCTANT